MLLGKGKELVLGEMHLLWGNVSLIHKLSVFSNVSDFGPMDQGRYNDRNLLNSERLLRAI